MTLRNTSVSFDELYHNVGTCLSHVMVKGVSITRSFAYFHNLIKVPCYFFYDSNSITVRVEDGEQFNQHWNISKVYLFSCVYLYFKHYSTFCKCSNINIITLESIWLTKKIAAHIYRLHIHTYRNIYIYISYIYTTYTHIY